MALSCIWGKVCLQNQCGPWICFMPSAVLKEVEKKCQAGDPCHQGAHCRAGIIEKSCMAQTKARMGWRLVEKFPAGGQKSPRPWEVIWGESSGHFESQKRTNIVSIGNGWMPCVLRPEKWYIERLDGQDAPDSEGRALQDYSLCSPWCRNGPWRKWSFVGETHFTQEHF